METLSVKDFLLAQYAAHPASRLQDLRKALHQSVFGCEHLVSDISAAAEGIRREATESGETRRTIEALNGPWARVYLGCLGDGLTPKTLAAAFARSTAMPHGDTAALEERLSVLSGLIGSGELPYDPVKAAAEIKEWRDAGFPACRHSADYRAAYRPAYRVLYRHYVGLLPLLTAIDRSLAVRPSVLLAIEGGAGSGKSTLAAELAELYPDVNVFHADDFFLRPEQRTEARYAQPGGNLDRERLEAEILQPLRQGEAAVYRPFDCHALALRQPVTAPQRRLNIVEGSYSFHPELQPYYDLSVFLDVTPETRLQRILARNGPEWAKVFLERWVPLEETYFHATDIRGRCALTLKEDIV